MNWDCEHMNDLCMNYLNEIRYVNFN